MSVRLKMRRYFVVFLLAVACLHCSGKSAPTEPSPPTQGTQLLAGTTWSGTLVVQSVSGQTVGNDDVPTDGTYCWDRYLTPLPSPGSTVQIAFRTTSGLWYGNSDGAWVTFYKLGRIALAPQSPLSAVVCEPDPRDNHKPVSFQGRDFSIRMICPSTHISAGIQGPFWQFSCRRSTLEFPYAYHTVRGPDKVTYLEEEARAEQMTISGTIISNRMEGDYDLSLYRTCGPGDEDWRFQCETGGWPGLPHVLGDLSVHGHLVLQKQ